ncbi:MAG TPA: 50S ribosomal protein L6 [Bacillota bacterium]|nr:50S ribosomal protein L6 [Bacillota bacterium]
MSRVGRKPVPLPPGVTIKLDGNRVQVTGPRGELVRDIPAPMKVEIGKSELQVIRPTDGRLHRSLHGLTRSLIANMVAGVTEGYQKNLELVGVGYRASLVGRKLVLNVGFSHQVEIMPPDGVDIQVPTPASVVVRSNCKETVGEVAARIRAVRPPEPYQGKGIRYAGEHVRRKAGKTGK